MKSAKYLMLVSVWVLVNFAPVQAHEGMWVPSLIKMFLSDMQDDGLKLSAEDIYAVNQSSLKDAIVHFNGGCTAEMISDQGLLLTNHHCGYSQIQYHSSVEHDYLKDGFWAMKKSEELTNPGLTATFIVRIEDVTEKVLYEVTDETPADKRAALIRQRSEEIVNQINESEPGHQAEIKPFYYGNQYFMIVTKTYRDVRLVGAPPSAVGKYGGDTDNWMWPRHTGDFSVFRIYADQDNNPADISEKNVPYRPKKALAVNIQGTEPGDFTMVYGFPGRTQQYLHSEAVKLITGTLNPHSISMRDRSLAIIVDAMTSSDEIRIQYAAKQARIANYWKKMQGENRGLERLKAIAKKEKLETEFAAKVKGSAELSQRYGKILEELEGLYETGGPLMMARSMLIEFYYYGPEFIRRAVGYRNLVENFEKLEEAGGLEAEIERLKNGAGNYYKNYQAFVDQEILEVLYPMYIEGLSPAYRPATHLALKAKYGNDWTKYAGDVFQKSFFVDQERETELLDKFSKKSLKKIKNDPGYQLANAVYEAWFRKAGPAYGAWNAKLDKAMEGYVDGLMTVFPDKEYWPDANSTLRIGWGKVEGSEPRDGVTYKPFTTLDGVIEKYVPGDREFDLPPRLLELAKARDYGRYADDGELPVCFTASNHTTGGNSGSPVLNAQGHLIGINFDRSWESTMSDIMYDPERCRNIVVDIRYVLWCIDKLGGAGHLVDEMNLID